MIRYDALVHELERRPRGAQVRQRLLEALGGARELPVSHVREAEIVVQRARVHRSQARASGCRAAALDDAEQRDALVERLVTLQRHGTAHSTT